MFTKNTFLGEDFFIFANDFSNYLITYSPTSEAYNKSID